jgi:hypothetical protein
MAQVWQPVSSIEAPLPREERDDLFALPGSEPGRQEENKIDTKNFTAQGTELTEEEAKAQKARLLSLSELIKRAHSHFDKSSGPEQAAKLSSVPWTLNREHGKKLYLPSNLESYADNLAVQGLLLCAYDLKYELIITTVSQTYNISDEVNNFFSMFWSTLRHFNGESKMLFRGASDFVSGRTSAYHEILKAHLDKRDFGILNYLPSVCFVGKARQELLTHYAERVIEVSAKKPSEILVRTLKTIALEFAKTRPSGDLKIWNLSQICSDIHRRRKEIITAPKRVEKLVPVHPKRPSERIEVFLKSEAKLISEDEVVFDEYQRIMKENQKTLLGAHEALALRNTCSELVKKCWEVVQKWTGVLTTRSKILNSKAKELKINNLTETSVKGILADIDKEWVKDFAFDLSPVNILIKTGNPALMNIGTLGRVQITTPIKDLKLNPDLEIHPIFIEYKALMPNFARRIIGDEEMRKRIVKRRPRLRKPRLLSDEEFESNQFTNLPEDDNVIPEENLNQDEDPLGGPNPES